MNREKIESQTKKRDNIVILDVQTIIGIIKVAENEFRKLYWGN